MTKQLQHVDILCWEHTGSRLGKHRPYICLQGDSCASDRLFAALDELSTGGVPHQLTITLKPCERRKACTSIRLLLCPVSSELQEMSLRRIQDTAVFEFTVIGMTRFREAVGTWRDGGEDFFVGPCRQAAGTRDQESGEVWFWTPLSEP